MNFTHFRAALLLLTSCIVWLQGQYTPNISNESTYRRKSEKKVKYLECAICSRVSKNVLQASSQQHKYQFSSVCLYLHVTSEDYHLHYEQVSESTFTITIKVLILELKLNWQFIFFHNFFSKQNSLKLSNFFCFNWESLGFGLCSTKPKLEDITSSCKKH